MNRILLLCITVLISVSSFGQIVKPGKLFTSVYELKGKVVFIKEIKIDNEKIKEAPFEIIKKWVYENYGKDHFYSSTNFDNKNKETVVKSRVDLVLPENKECKLEMVTMRYRLNCFILQDKCVIEFENISFVHDCFKKSKLYPSRVVRANQLINDEMLKLDDELKVLRENTKKSTLYFLNQIANELEVKFGHPKLMDN